MVDKEEAIKEDATKQALARNFFLSSLVRDSWSQRKCHCVCVCERERERERKKERKRERVLCVCVCV